MNKTQVFVSALLLSLLFSALMTELTMQVSTRTAMDEINQISLEDDALRDWHFAAEASDTGLDQTTASVDEINESLGKIQGASSVYQYPGYWVFWLQSFLWVFFTTLVVSLLQSLWILRQIKQRP